MQCAALTMPTSATTMSCKKKTQKTQKGGKKKKKSTFDLSGLFCLVAHDNIFLVSFFFFLIFFFFSVVSQRYEAQTVYMRVGAVKEETVTNNNSSFAREVLPSCAG